MEISQINPDGNVYDVKDATARTEIAQIKAQGTYSTEEASTGKTWIDGKPIYRKVYTGTFSVSANQTVIIVPIANIDNPETMISVTGFMKTGTTDYPFISNTSTSLAWHPSGTYAGITVSSTSARSNVPITIYYEYTKTTD